MEAAQSIDASEAEKEKEKHLLEEERVSSLYPCAWSGGNAAVVVDQKSCRIRYAEDEGSGAVVTLGTASLLVGSEEKKVFYYEVEVLCLAVFSTLTVGFSNVVDEAPGVCPGKYQGSCGLSSRGECAVNGRKVYTSGELGEWLDRVYARAYMEVGRKV